MCIAPPKNSTERMCDVVISSTLEKARARPRECDTFVRYLPGGGFAPSLFSLCSQAVGVPMFVSAAVCHRTRTLARSSAHVLACLCAFVCLLAWLAGCFAGWLLEKPSGRTDTSLSLRSGQGNPKVSWRVQWQACGQPRSPHAMVNDISVKPAPCDQGLHQHTAQGPSPTLVAGSLVLGTSPRVKLET